MAKIQKVSKSTVSNIWRGRDVMPHRLKRFKLSRDPRFLEKLTDVVGLYLSPPQLGMVICVDKKSQIQAVKFLASGNQHTPTLRLDANSRLHQAATIPLPLDSGTTSAPLQTASR